MVPLKNLACKGLIMQNILTCWSYCNNYHSVETENIHIELWLFVWMSLMEINLSVPQRSGSNHKSVISHSLPNLGLEVHTWVPKLDKSKAWWVKLFLVISWYCAKWPRITRIYLGTDLVIWSNFYSCKDRHDSNTMLNIMTQKSILHHNKPQETLICHTLQSSVHSGHNWCTMTQIYIITFPSGHLTNANKRYLKWQPDIMLTTIMQIDFTELESKCFILFRWSMVLFVVTYHKYQHISKGT